MRSNTLGLNTYFLAGGLVLLLSWAMTGCIRPGNNIVPATGQEDPLTGYYQTQPQNLQFCVTYHEKQAGDPDPQPQDTCTTAQANQVPSLVSAAMSQPAAFLVQSYATGESVIFDPESNPILQLPMFVDPDSLALSLSAANTPKATWGYESCSQGFSLVASGGLSSYETQNVLGYPTIGRIQLGFVVIDSFTGDCYAALQEMQDCYFDENTCGGADADENLLLQSDVRGFFADAIDSGVMSANEIRLVKSIAYEADYE